MRRFTWRPNGGSSSQDADDQSFKSDDRTHDPTDSSPARSSSSRGLSAGKARGADGGSPPGVPSATAAFTGGGGGTPSTGGGSSNRKMLKIGRNVRFRGDVMECDTVVVCGRLQVGVLCLVVLRSRGIGDVEVFVRMQVIFSLGRFILEHVCMIDKSVSCRCLLCICHTMFRAQSMCGTSVMLPIPTCCRPPRRENSNFSPHPSV